MCYCNLSHNHSRCDITQQLKWRFKIQTIRSNLSFTYQNIYKTNKQIFYRHRNRTQRRWISCCIKTWGNYMYIARRTIALMMIKKKKIKTRSRHANTFTPSNKYSVLMTLNELNRWLKKILWMLYVVNKSFF